MTILFSPNVAPSASYPSFDTGPGDQSAALQAWLDEPGYKKMPGGRNTIRLDSGVVVPPDNLDARKIDFGNTVFDCSRMDPATGPCVIGAYGVIGTKRILGANVSAGATVLPILAQNTVGLIPGQMVRIGSNGLFDSQSTGSRLGELNFLAAVGPGNSITLAMPLRDSYRFADGAFVEEIINDMRGLEILGGEFYGPEDVMNNMVGINTAFLHNPKIMGQQFNYCDHIGVAFRSCYRGESDVQVYNTRPSTTGYGVSYFDASLGGVAKGTFRNVRHAASTNNSPSTQYGAPRDITFRDMHALYSAPALAGSQAGGAAFDTHTAAENISFIDCTSQGSTGPALSVECPTATIRNFKAFDSLSTVAAVHVNNKSDRYGVYNVSGIQVWGSAGAGVRVQSTPADPCVLDFSGFDIRDCSDHNIILQNLGGSYIGGGVSHQKSSAKSGINMSGCARMTIGPFTAIGGCNSVNGSCTNSVIVRGADSSSGGVSVSGSGNTVK